jgi:hypothetical protein
MFFRSLKNGLAVKVIWLSSPLIIFKAFSTSTALLSHWPSSVSSRKLLYNSFKSHLYSRQTKYNHAFSLNVNCQTWANDHLSTTTTCLQRPPVYNDHYFSSHFREEKRNLWTTTTCKQRPLFLGPNGGRRTQDWL